jgi:hypothetical protein
VFCNCNFSALVGEVDKELGGVSFMKQNGLQRRPDEGIIPMFAENISSIVLGTDMDESQDVGSNGFPTAVER